MVSTFTPSRNYELPGTGDYVDSWGPVINDNFTDIDLNISGTQALTVSSSNVTLTPTQAKNMIFAVTGTLTATVTITYPATGGFFIVSNLTAGAFNLGVTSAGGGTGVIVPQGQRSMLYCDGVNVCFASDAAAVEIGSGMDYWGTTAPPRWLFPYGQAISRTTYSALFARLGITYGAGDGSTTFNLPDKRDRASWAKGNMGGVSAGRITGLAGGWSGNVLGTAGGQESVTLTLAQIAAHSHSGGTDAQGLHTHSYESGDATLAATGATTISGGPTPKTTGASGLHTHTVTTDSQGGGQLHNNLPPGIVCNYIIYAGI